jgi:cation/acetate symporter
MWDGLSTASAEAVAKYQELKAAYAAAAPDAQAAAWTALDKHAQTIANWWGVKNLSAAAFGLPVGFVVMVLVSMFTKEPSRELQDFIEEIRIPKGKTVMEEKTA